MEQDETQRRKPDEEFKDSNVMTETHDLAAAVAAADDDDDDGQKSTRNMDSSDNDNHIQVNGCLFITATGAG